MNLNNSYKSVLKEAHCKNKVGSCRFYGSVKSVKDEASAEGFIQTVRQEHSDASHHVWAYRIGIKQIISRYSDDGEPANSAGPPVARAIEGCGLTNVVVVITRYYGGVNQGVGGLIRAYGRTATMVLKEAGSEEHLAFQQLEIKPVTYAQLGDVIRSVENHQGKISDIVYNIDVKVIASLQPERLDSFKTNIRDITRGQAQLSLGELVWHKKE